MQATDIKKLLVRVFEAQIPESSDLESLLKLRGADLQPVFDFADEIRKKFIGQGVLLRGIIEFSNFCGKSCSYCGLNRYNEQLKRYRLSSDEILQCADSIFNAGIRTIVLQSGEDKTDAKWLADVIAEIKSKYDTAITLSVGERSLEDYQLWKTAGADRYLLKMETFDRDLYEQMHPGMNFDNRIECLKNLRNCGYQTGSGNIVGLPGQTVKHLAKDLIAFRQYGFDMVSVSPFIAHPETELGDSPNSELELVLLVTALTRIVTRDAHLPATTALGSIGPGDQRFEGLKAGANVIMPNFSPVDYKKLYEIYPGKRCVNEAGDLCVGCLEMKAKNIGRSLDFSRGDSFKREVFRIQ